MWNYRHYKMEACLDVSEKILKYLFLKKNGE